MGSSISPRDFVEKWRKTTIKERSAVQEHFIDLCHLIDHPTPAEAIVRRYAQSSDCIPVNIPSFSSNVKPQTHPVSGV